MSVKNSHGFTLMEILIAMTILAIITGVGFTAFTTSLRRSRDAQRKQGLEQLQRALENFINDVGVYPQASVNERMYDDVNGGDYAWGGTFDYEVRGETVDYMERLPKDPLTDRTYKYYVSNDRKKYVVYAALENLEDPAALGGLTVDCGQTVDCNYFVLSPNLATDSALNN